MRKNFAITLLSSILMAGCGALPTSVTSDDDRLGKALSVYETMLAAISDYQDACKPKPVEDNCHTAVATAKGFIVLAKPVIADARAVYERGDTAYYPLAIANVEAKTSEINPIAQEAGYVAP